MEKEFVSYEIALELKQLGFDDPCIGKFYYNQLEIGGIWTNNDFKEDPDIFISAPLYQQVFRWFREKYGVYARPDKFDVDQWWVDWGDWNSSIYGTYEEAEHEWLLKIIEIAKN
ncbi:MAG: hypothetical protein K9I82_01740 [Chitinophagaceae bacterium]|nr:hypothetical protein [Chitinophagaceae bacterium]